MPRTTTHGTAWTVDHSRVMMPRTTQRTTVHPPRRPTNKSPRSPNAAVSGQIVPRGQPGSWSQDRPKLSTTLNSGRSRQRTRPPGSAPFFFLSKGRETIKMWRVQWTTFFLTCLLPSPVLRLRATEGAVPALCTLWITCLALRVTLCLSMRAVLTY